GMLTREPLVNQQAHMVHLTTSADGLSTGSAHLERTSGWIAVILNLINLRGRPSNRDQASAHVFRFDLTANPFIGPSLHVFRSWRQKHGIGRSDAVHQFADARKVPVN